MRTMTNCTRLALIVLSSCAMAGGGLAHADTPQAGTIPPGWVWQGVWQDGRWTGQWMPGPAAGTGAYPSSQAGPSHAGAPPASSAYPPVAYAAPGGMPVVYAYVPVVTAQQAPVVETRTVTTEYVPETEYPPETRERVIRARRHHRAKRGTTGN